MSTLGGAVCIRNGDIYDFCWRESVNSLLPVCDEVCICVGTGNEDNTEQEAREWAAREPKINLCMYPWPEPKGDADFWVKWLNYAREHLKSEWHFQLDADEVLHEKSYAELRRFVEAPSKGRSGSVTRLNFYRDAKHLIPNGHCLGKYVIRVAPTRMWIASDGYHPNATEVTANVTPTEIEIYHYGFIRKHEAYFVKERKLQGYFFDNYDPRLEKAEVNGKDWANTPGLSDWENMLDPWEGTHPAVMLPWLRERGYEV